MKITGTSSLTAPPQRVWDAVHDPAVLARCLPGCERLTELGEDRYAMTVTAGVAAIRGTYDGEVALLEPQPPASFAMRASGVGASGTVDAVVAVRLAETPHGGTEVHYDADASVGGPIGGVGQRMLSGVTRRMAGQFFTAVDAHLAAAQAPSAPGGAAGSADALHAAAAAGVSAGAPPAEAAPETGQVADSSASGRRSFTGRAVEPASASGSALQGAKGFALGVLAGGAVALLGVALGARLGRRG